MKTTLLYPAISLLLAQCSCKETHYDHQKTEGDIMLPRKVFNKYYHHGGHNGGKPSGPEPWPRAIVPVRFADNNFNREEKTIIKKAMREFHLRTCVRFRRKRGNQHFLEIFKGNGCFASGVGYNYNPYTYYPNNPNRVSLGNGCFRHGVIVHELMHALGFWHEQSRPDRDNYVDIHREYIAKKYHFDFDIVSHHHPAVMNSPYDICSIMHYFVNNYTIVAKKRKQCEDISGHNWEVGSRNLEKMGQAQTFTDSDLSRIRQMYCCSGIGKVSKYKYREKGRKC